jgi:hypothetical protein
MYIVQRYLLEGSISLMESKNVFQTIKNNYNNYPDKNCEIIFVRKMGIGLSMILGLPNSIYFEDMTKTVIRLNINKCMEELKIKVYEELF